MVVVFAIHGDDATDVTTCPRIVMIMTTMIAYADAYDEDAGTAAADDLHLMVKLDTKFGHKLWTHACRRSVFKIKRQALT